MLFSVNVALGEAHANKYVKQATSSQLRDSSWTATLIIQEAEESPWAGKYILGHLDGWNVIQTRF